MPQLLSRILSDRSTWKSFAYLVLGGLTLLSAIVGNFLGGGLFAGCALWLLEIFGPPELLSQDDQ